MLGRSSWEPEGCRGSVRAGARVRTEGCKGEGCKGEGCRGAGTGRGFWEAATPCDECGAGRRALGGTGVANGVVGQGSTCEGG